MVRLPGATETRPISRINRCILFRLTLCGYPGPLCTPIPLCFEHLSQARLSNWMGSHIRALEYFGGVPEVIIPYNLKSGVNNACRYEPDVNATYHDFAVHYDTVSTGML